MGKLLYSPDKQTVENAEITTFMHFFAEKNGLDLNNYHDFHRASLTHKGQFWDNLREFYGVIGDFSGPALDVGSHMKFDQYFPEARLNYAENLLAPFADADDMLVFSSERQNYRKLDAATVRNHVTALASYMRDNDICKGDRVAAVMPNMPETVTTMLAATSLGAVWASCSPDFGVESIIDRFGQIRPKIVIICDQYRYNGKMIDLSKHIAALQERMTEVKKFIIVPFEEELNSEVKTTDKIASYLDIITQNQGTQLKFTPVGFRDPLF
ncbi:MAG: AMP-binding protein, partial [Pseudomonadota bacterium]